MVENKMYKTRLCVLYQSGRCSRQHCNFAHGQADLRPSFSQHITNNTGRQDRGRDLRERLERMRSPLRTDSPGKDTGGRHSSHGDSPRSFGKRNDRNQRKRQRVDGHSDYSGSLRMVEGTEEQSKDRRHIAEQVQLREMNSEIKKLDKEKKRLKAYLEDRDQESKSLHSKIQDLQKQLLNEKAQCKRITTKMKKFIKAHNRFLRLKDELNRAESELQKLGEQLDLDAAGPDNDDDLNVISDDENDGKYASSPLDDHQINSSVLKRRSPVSPEAREGLKEVDRISGQKTERGKDGTEILYRQSGHGHYDKFKNNSKRPEADGDADNIYNALAYEDMSLRPKLPPDNSLADKHKASEIGLALPPTAIAAHAIDEDVEVVEKDERFQGASTRIEKEVALIASCKPFLPPPLPPIPQNVYQQYKGDDARVDIDGLEEEMVEVDIL